MPSPGSDQAAEFAAFMRDHHDMVFSTAVRILADEAYRKKMVEHNFKVATRHYSYTELRRLLRILIGNIATQYGL